MENSKQKVKQIIAETIQKVLNEAENGGWVVETDEAREAYELAAQEFGNEELNSAIIRCIPDAYLAECLAYIFRLYDFKEWKSRGER